MQTLDKVYKPRNRLIQIRNNPADQRPDTFIKSTSLASRAWFQQRKWSTCNMCDNSPPGHEAVKTIVISDAPTTDDDAGRWKGKFLRNLSMSRAEQNN